MTRLSLAAVALAAAALAFWGCDSTDSGGDPPGTGGGAGDSAVDPPADGSVDHEGGATCVNVAAPTSCPDPPVVFDDVRRIIGQRCSTPCHNGAPANGSQWPLMTYEDMEHWENEIRAALLSCTMPPLDAGVGITADEKLAILTWLKCDLPR